MKVAFVVQRYGDDLIGGAESLCKQIAENLVKDLNWDIDVYTTTAKDYRTWQAVYPAGVEPRGKITLRRFDCRFARVPSVFQAFNRCVSGLLVRKPRWALLQKLLAGCEQLWFALQGPYCPKLVAALHSQAEQYEKIFFFTYLYYPSVYGLEGVRSKAVLVPSAHDERPLYFPKVQKLFAQVPCILVNCEEEKKLLLAKTAAKPSCIHIAGIGIDQISKAGSVRPSLPRGLASKPYLLFLGRLCKGKGVCDLIAAYLQHVKNHGQTCDLYLAGVQEKGFRIPVHPHIHNLGIVTEQEKLVLIQKALALVNPSPHESLSLIVLEGLALKVPVLVNAINPVLKAYTKHNPSVFAYDHAQEFSTYVTYLLSSAWRDEAESKLAASEAWVQEVYSWQKIAAVYLKASQTVNPCLPS